MAYLSPKTFVQSPAYGLRDRCPSLWLSYRKCLNHADVPYEECAGMFDDYIECNSRSKQRQYQAKVEQGILRQREKFADEVRKELLLNTELKNKITKQKK